jgi:hypothetical protein
MDPVVYTPIYGATMPRDRFMNILHCFHLNDNTNYISRGEEGFDPLFKVRPLLDIANARFNSVYVPERHVAIDEGMVPWKERLSFKQYIPSKPDKFGMKAYVLCESCSGYVCKMDIYTGKDFDPNPNVVGDISVDEGQTYQIVFGLLASCNLLNLGYSLYVDNYYSSPRLFESLYNAKTTAVGTVRINRKEMPLALKQKLKIGEVVVRQRGSLTALKWRDKRDVCVLSTKHAGTFKILFNKIERSSGDPRTIPSCVADYNEHMGGVDRSDQLNKYYSITRKTLKWWKKLALHVINVMITNAYIIYRKFSVKRMSHYDFRKELVKCLIARHQRTHNLKGRRAVGAPEKRLVDRHFIDRYSTLQYAF